LANRPGGTVQFLLDKKPGFYFNPWKENLHRSAALDARINPDSGKVFVDLGVPRKARVDQAREALGVRSFSELFRRWADEMCDRIGIPPVGGANAPRAQGSRDGSIGVRAADQWFKAHGYKGYRGDEV
jgi:hypothetical protein